MPAYDPPASTGGGGAPSGPAGGQLAGTYPDPTVAASHSGSTHTATQTAAEATAAAAAAVHVALPSAHHTAYVAADHTAVGDASPHHARAHAMDGASDHTAATLGDLIYAAALGVWTKLAGNTIATRKFLRQTGTGVVSAVPVWDTIADADVPSSHSGSTHAATQAAAEATASGALATHVAAVDPHIGYVLESLLDAKGDLIAASADNTPAKVAVGADGTFLKADSAAGAGVSWATPTATPPVLVGPKNVVSTVEVIAANTYVHVGRSLEITSAGSIEIAATSILEITP